MLAAGHFACFRDGQLRIEQYWDLRFETEDRSEAEWTELVRDGVTAAVRRQMLSDVPVGSFLSGGDRFVRRRRGDGRGSPTPTYTVGFAEEDMPDEIVPSDLPYARRMGATLGTDYHEEILRPNAVELLPKAVWHLEEPLADPAAISTYLICREAGRDMKVMLSGMGGDEIFAGYPRYLAWKISRAMDRLPSRVGARGRLARRGPSLAPARRGACVGRAGTCGSTSGRQGCRHSSATSRSPAITTAASSTQFCRRPYGQRLPAMTRSRYTASICTRDTGGDELTRLLYADAKTFLPCLNLTYTDKLSMAASVEVRVPLLDDELVDLAAPHSVEPEASWMAPKIRLQEEPGSSFCHATSSGDARPASERRSARGFRKI